MLPSIQKKLQCQRGKDCGWPKFGEFSCISWIKLYLVWCLSAIMPQPLCLSAIMPICISAYLAWHDANLQSCWSAIMLYANMPICQHAYLPLCLSVIMPICHKAYLPSCLSAMLSICYHTYWPSCLSRIIPISHHANQPSCLSSIRILIF